MDEISRPATGVVDAQPVTIRLGAESLTIFYEMERREQVIPLAAVTGLEDQIGLMTGNMVVEWGPDRVTLTRIPRSEARALVAALRAAVGTRPATSGPRPVAEHPRSTRSDTSPLADLERLARLRESGVLDEEEFAAAKRRLLDRL